MYLIAAFSAILLILFLVMAFSRPKGYTPPEPTEANEISPYLTHKLIPELYNGIQQGVPFELVVTQEGINDIILRSSWPLDTGEMVFFAPRVFFIKDNIVLRGAASVKGAKFIITIVSEAGFDEEGLMALNISDIRMGSVSITPLAKLVAKRYFKQLGFGVAGSDKLERRIISRLFDGEPFEPVFSLGDDKVKVSSVAIEPGVLTIGMAPEP